MGTEILDLQPFCGTNPERHYLMKPFTRRGYTWSTNGHILIRTPARDGVGDVEKEFNVERPLEGIESADFLPLPHFELPTEEPGDCEACEGRGLVHDCPDCGCTCEVCDGKGQAAPWHGVSIEIDKVHFAAKYLAMIKALAQPEIAKAHPTKPLLFRFDGGVGAVMPLRYSFPNNIVVR